MNDKTMQAETFAGAARERGCDADEGALGRAAADGGAAGSGEAGVSWRLIVFTILFWLFVIGFSWLITTPDCGFRDYPEACLSDQRREIFKTCGIGVLLYAGILYARHRCRNA